MATGTMAADTPPHRGLQMLASLGGVAAGGAAVMAVIVGWEALWARETTKSKQRDYDPRATGYYAGDQPGEPLHLALLGDSLAVGVGCESPAQTVGALLAKGLAAEAARPVQLYNVAVVGAQSKDLAAQMAALLNQGNHFDVALVIVGSNDVVHGQRPKEAGRFLSAVVHQCRRIGAHVVVATCPDMGTVHPLIQPLRAYAYWASRLLATTQTIVVLRAGGRTVSLADLLGPLFSREPTIMFSFDNYHPSPVGYARAAEVLLPSVCAAAGCWTRKEVTVPHRVHVKGRPHPMAWLAFRASRFAGTEVSSKPGREDDGVTIGRRILRRLPRQVRVPGRGVVPANAQARSVQPRRGRAAGTGGGTGSSEPGFAVDG